MRALVVGTVVAVALAACGGTGAATAKPFTTVNQVRVTRTPGLLALPPVDRTITDASVVNRLAADIEGLPLFPSGSVSCPLDTGTSYNLAFSGSAGIVWTAVVDAGGCRAVTLSDGATRSAMQSDRLFRDLGTALGLTSDEVLPVPCPRAGGGRCYTQSTMQAAVRSSTWPLAASKGRLSRS